jgi:hypothetical protein
MRFTNFAALTDHEPRGFKRRKSYEAIRGLFAEGDPAAPAGGAAPAAAAPATPATPASTPAAAAPAAATPSAPAGDAAAAGSAEPTAAEKVAALEPLVDPKATPAAEVKPEDRKAFLIAKGAKAEELDALKPEELKAKYDEAKAKDATPADKDKKPVEIEIKVPEGIEIGEKEVAEFKALMTDEKLSPADRAQKLVEMHAAALKATAEKPMALWFETQKQWQEQVRADSEIGGTNLDANRSNIAKAITDIMGDKAAETFEALKYTGAANHPAIVRLFARMSKAFVEGGPASGSAPGAGHSKDFASRVAAMYPSATGSQQQAGS